MNFSSMEYFVALAEERSFTRAAQRLMVTQQTLSAHIASMERELGVRLVNRKVPLTLTYAGEVLLGYARRFETDRRAMVQEFADIAGDEQGLLAVGIASTRGRLLMPRAIAAFRERKPGVRVLIDEEENEELVEALREGRVDMTVATVPPGMPGFEVRLLRTEQIALLVSWRLLRRLYGEEARQVAEEVVRNRSLAPLKECPFLLLGRHDEPGDLSRRLIEQAGLSMEPTVVSSNSETLVELAIRDMGATFVPVDLARDLVGDGEASQMCIMNLGPDARIDIHMAWRSSSHVWSVIEDFADLLARQVSEDVQ
ncbi:MAG: LysR family transcriptional regulator [Atopobiaceae bacterium]|nr:LysR family transcriptional regulator [Atopobiaceae bacterium]MDO4404076.1 LysR family transcriptional regulator [Atopobiaceae bacterium]